MVKSKGAIVVARNRSPQRRRFSIAHELGHFLIPDHRPAADGQLLCSADQLRLLSGRDQYRRTQMEVEANRFAALLLIPPSRLQLLLSQQTVPDISQLIHLARRFDVSCEAMARSYATHHDEAVAILVSHCGQLLRIYRGKTMPWIPVAPGSHMTLGNTTAWNSAISPIVECDPDDWFLPDIARATSPPSPRRPYPSKTGSQ